MAEKAEAKPQNLTHLLGALFYFDSMSPTKRKDATPFEKLTEAEQQPYAGQAARFISYLDKLNFMVCIKTDPKKEAESEARNLEILTTQIKDFVKGLTTTKPALFPCEELAARILRGPEK